MSKPSAQPEILAALGPLVGQRIPGGCDHCKAFQTVAPMAGGPGWIISVHHDDWCPAYIMRRGKGRES